jgi:hypothetical protein
LHSKLYTFFYFANNAPGGYFYFTHHILVLAEDLFTISLFYTLRQNEKSLRESLQQYLREQHSCQCCSLAIKFSIIFLSCCQKRFTGVISSSVLYLPNYFAALHRIFRSSTSRGTVLASDMIIPVYFSHQFILYFL